MKRLLLLAGASLLFAACAESPTSPTTGRRIAPTSANHDDDFKCESGYVVAYDEQGNPYCVPVDGGRMSGNGNNGGGGNGGSVGGPP